jgi:hypothetical protein
MSNLEERDDELNQKMVDSPPEEAIKILVKDANRRKRQLRLLTISVIFDIVLSLALAYGWQQNHSLAIKAETNKNAIIHNCETSNDSRKKNHVLWDYILALPPAQPLTSDQQLQRDNFSKFVDQTFAQRDCKAEVNK